MNTPQRFHEKALASGLVTPTDVTSLDAEIAPHITGPTRANAIDVKCFVHLHQASASVPRSNAMTRWNLRNCDDLHQATKGKAVKGPISIVESRLGVLTKASGLVNRTHQKTDCTLAAPDSQFTANDFRLTDGQWAWLCIPGKPNAFAQGTRHTSQRTATPVAALITPPTSSPSNNSISGLSAPHNGLKRKQFSDDGDDIDDNDESKPAKRLNTSHCQPTAVQPTPPLSDSDEFWVPVVSGVEDTDFIDPSTLMPQDPSEFENSAEYDYMTPAAYFNAADAAAAADRFLDDVIAGITETIGDRQDDIVVEPAVRRGSDALLDEQYEGGNELYRQSFEDLLEMLWED